MVLYEKEEEEEEEEIFPEILNLCDYEIHKRIDRNCGQTTVR